MANLLGRRADGWIAPLATGFETKPAAQDHIDRAAISAGREPSDIRRVIQLIGAGTDRPETQQRPVRGPGNQPLRTTAGIWAEIIAELGVDERFDTVNLIPQHETPEQIASFGEHVIPLARDAVNAMRTKGGSTTSRSRPPATWTPRRTWREDEPGRPPRTNASHQEEGPLSANERWK
jgi:hypothetical protein